MIISIDGPAGSGKSTVAEELSKKLKYIHFNSGSLYRAITAYLLDNNFDFTSQKLPNDISLRVEYFDNSQHVFVNDIDYTNKLRLNQISELSPIVSSIPKVREIIDNCQRKFASTHNVVVDGRDIGSYVFPNADCKFYLDCDVKIRAQRRFDELKDKTNVTLQDIEEQIKKRDEIDKNKKIAPLVIPKNAVVIDSSHLSINVVVKEMMTHVLRRLDQLNN